MVSLKVISVGLFHFWLPKVMVTVLDGLSGGCKVCGSLGMTKKNQEGKQKKCTKKKEIIRRSKKDD